MRLQGLQPHFLPDCEYSVGTRLSAKNPLNYKNWEINTNICAYLTDKIDKDMCTMREEKDMVVR